MKRSMPPVSAGLLMFRRHNAELQVLLVHPGGPFFRNKDDGVWTVPKGEVEPGEDLLATAQREFQEETGLKPMGPFTALASVKQKSGKIVHAWAFEGDCDPSTVSSNRVLDGMAPEVRSANGISRGGSHENSLISITQFEDQFCPSEIARRA